jgi:hypothetical protein
MTKSPTVIVPIERSQSSIAFCVLALHQTFQDALSGQKHHHCQGAGEDEVLSGIQECQRGGNLDGSLFVRFEGVVKLLDFELFVVEVLASWNRGLESCIDETKRSRTHLYGLIVDQ